MTDQKPAHSPLGASSAERWMNCPGSVNIIKSIVGLPEPSDPEYRLEGTAAHEAIAYCLSGSGFEAWEVIGQKFVGVTVTKEMADAIQVFIDAANALAAGADKTFVEAKISSPDHPMFYGTVDFAAVKDGTLYILDYKHGQGIVVPTQDNPQMMYYAYGILLQHPDVRRVSMQIIQPRVPFRNDEPWVVAAEDIAQWAETKMFPAMERTKTDNTLATGEHCRFCPAKDALACPAMNKLLAEMEENVAINPTVADFPEKDLVAHWAKISAVKMYLAAIQKETLRRLMANQMADNGVCKLVNQKANRVWKAEAIDVFKSRFGDKAWNAPEFKSPAEMEKVDADAKAMVKTYAYTPQSGLTVVDIDDKRPAVIVKTATEAFAKVLTAEDL